jgi:ABC-type multidrug transport system ATPase subunit
MLKVKDISKAYGSIRALNNLSLELSDGVYGLLGPNGAGKSTFMNILTDNLMPDCGQVMFNGQSIWKMPAEFRRLLGYAPQQQGLYDAFTGRRFLSYMGTLKEISGGELPGEVERAAEFVNLTHVLDKRLGSYSGGMKQRMLIAQAIMGNPKLLLMDEPTAGLDPKERIRIRNNLKEISRERIILIATHVVGDVQSISKEIIILKKGCLVAKASPQELIDTYAPGGDLEDVYMNIFQEDEKL